MIIERCGLESLLLQLTEGGITLGKRSIADLQRDCGFDLDKLKNKCFVAYYKPLIDKGKTEAAVRLAELVHDKVAPPSRRFNIIRAALAVWNSLGDYAKSFVWSPLVKDDPALPHAIESVKLASVPMEQGYDEAFETLTGWGRKTLPAYRARRTNLLEEKHSTGLLFKIKQQNARDARNVCRKVDAMKYWVRKTNPRNLGAGKRDLVCTCTCITCTHCMIDDLILGYSQIKSDKGARHADQDLLRW